RALAGRMAPHQRFLLTEQLCHIDALDEGIARVSAEIAERMRPFAEALERLDTIPGIGQRMAEILVAEIGIDMSRFPSAAHLASWAGMCPGNQESAGKRKTGRTRKGNVWLRAALVEAAHSLGRGRGTYLAAQYRRLTARRGKKKAASLSAIPSWLSSTTCSAAARCITTSASNTSTRVAANGWN